MTASTAARVGSSRSGQTCPIELDGERDNVGRMLMAEEVLLLLVDDRTGRFLVDSTRLDNTVLAGTVLVELVTIERVGFPSAGGGAKRGRMVVVDPTPLGDPVLDGALVTVAAGRPAKPEQLIAKVRKRLRATLLERLTAAGALRRSTRKVLGIPWRTTWPASDSSHKRELRARLQDVLVAGATPSTPRRPRSSSERAQPRQSSGQASRVQLQTEGETWPTDGRIMAPFAAVLAG